MIGAGGVAVLEDPENLAAARRAIHPEFEGSTRGNALMAGPYRGPDGWVSMQFEWAEIWDEAEYEITDYEERGDEVDCRVRYRVQVNGAETEGAARWHIVYRENPSLPVRD